VTYLTARPIEANQKKPPQEGTEYGGVMHLQ
jgi:hypothetical protein